MEDHSRSGRGKEIMTDFVSGGNGIPSGSRLQPIVPPPTGFSPLALPPYELTTTTPPGFLCHSLSRSPNSFTDPESQSAFDPMPQTEFGAALLRESLYFRGPTAHIMPPPVGPSNVNQTVVTPSLLPLFPQAADKDQMTPPPPSIQPSDHHHQKEVGSSCNAGTSNAVEVGAATRRGLKRRSSSSRTSPPSPERSQKLIAYGMPPANNGSDTESDDNIPNKKVELEDDGYRTPVTGDRALVEKTLLTFDSLRRRCSQMDDRQAELKAAGAMVRKGHRVNWWKTVGPNNGVAVGDIFYSTFEMFLVGLHSSATSPVDQMRLISDREDEIVAISVISAGSHEDKLDDPEAIVVFAEQVERGNRALQNSIHRNNEIRVIRQVKDPSGLTGFVFVYDGLYRVQEAWIERSRGHAIFKYALVRSEGQPNGITIWKSIKRWRDNPTSRPGLITADVSSGAETLPVCLTNTVDQEKGPTPFRYSTGVKHSIPIRSMRSIASCGCSSVCVPGDPNCRCATLNGGNLPYSSSGVLVSQKTFVFECGAMCACSGNCRNRVSQKGVQYRFEVFRTKDRGWGLRSWDPIRAGSLICEYAGERIDQMIKVDDDDDDDEDGYIFENTAPNDDPSQWNYDPALLGEDSPAEPLTRQSQPFALVISAKNMGNVARFMNHSCSPNTFWQPVAYNHEDHCYGHIMFYAIKHIPPLTELTYDYGVSEQTQLGHHKVGFMTGWRKTQKCLCGSPHCRGFFG